MYYGLREIKNLTKKKKKIYNNNNNLTSRHRIQSLNLISHFLQIQYNSEMLNFFLQTN